MQVHSWIAAALLGPTLALTAQAQESSGAATAFRPSATLSQAWSNILTEADSDDILETLSGAGFNPASVSSVLKDDAVYTLYEQIVGPGMKEYLMVPSTGNAVTFSPANAGYGNRVYPVDPKQMTPPTIDTDAVVAEVAERFNQGIDAACDFRIKPSQIRVQVTAWNTLEIEGTWDSDDVCSQP